MNKRPPKQDLTKKTHKKESAVGNGCTINAIKMKPIVTNKTERRSFWKILSGLTTKKSNPNKSAPRKEQEDIFRTDFIAEVQPVVAVGKDMCPTSIQEAFQLITVSTRYEEPKSPEHDADWVIVHYAQTESTLLLKPARYIQRCLLPTFHRRDVRPIINRKTPDLLPARIDCQYLLDLKRTRVSEKVPNMTKQWCVNGQSLPRDPVQNLAEIKRHTHEQSFQVTQLLNQRIGIDMTRKIQLYCKEAGFFTHLMPIIIGDSRSLSLCTHDKCLTITGRASYQLVGLCGGILDDETSCEHGHCLHIQGVYDLCSGDVEYVIHTNKMVNS